MDELPHAYKCLPLVIANQWGWQVLCPTDVVVTWDGTAGSEGLRVEVPPQFEPAIKSQFGAGIVTFSPPWLFRTPPGWDLYLKGPSNRWKPNCVPLEGVIETWWLNYTFTLNWKLIEPGVVTFAQGESLAQLVPVPHGTFSSAPDDPLSGFFRSAAFVPYTAQFNVTGQPAAVVPWDVDGIGVPTSIQLVGRPFDEATLLSLGAQVERERPWAQRRPLVS